MKIPIPSNGLAFSISFSIRTNGKRKIRILAKHPTAPNTNYTDREVWINGWAPFVLQFPISPEKLDLVIYDVEAGFSAEGRDKTFNVQNFNIGKLQTCNGNIKKRDREFLEFMCWFAENAGYLSLGEYVSKNRRFRILYLETITTNDGKASVTPASVGHQTKRMKFARDKILPMSVFERIPVGGHEYSHVYKNPEVGKRVDDEVAADLNMLRILLPLGYPRYDIKHVFASVFYQAPSDMNTHRLRVLDDYITKFDKGQILGSCKFQLPKAA